MDTKRRIGLRVKAIRKARGLTQEQFAELIERSVDAVSLLERGLVLPSFETLERLAERVGVPLKDLVDTEHDVDPERNLLVTELIETTRTLDNDLLEVALAQLKALAALAHRRT